MSRRQERRADEVELGWVVITRLDARIRAVAMRVDKLAKGTTVNISGPGVYVKNPDVFLSSMKTRTEYLLPRERVLRILPKGHPEVTR